MGALGDGERAPFSVRAAAVTAAATQPSVFPTVVGWFCSDDHTRHSRRRDEDEPTMAGHALAAGSLAGRERISARGRERA